MRKQPVGKIIQKMRIAGDRGKARVAVILDSGSSWSLIRRDLAERLVSHMAALERPRRLKGVGGKDTFSVSQACIIGVEMKGKVREHLFHVVDRITRPLVVGCDFMQTWKVKLDLAEEEYTVGVDPDAVDY